MTRNRFHSAARGASVVVLGVGATVLVGWLCGVAPLTRVLPGLVTMKVNTAVAFLFAGTSLLVQISPRGATRRARAGGACALCAMMIGIATLAEYVLGVDLGIDQLVMRAPAVELATYSPGRMAPNTALGFALAGAALGLLDARARAARRGTQVMALAALLIGFVACTGYLLGITALYGVAGYASMAIHTAIGLLALSTGILLSRPQRGVIAILGQDNSAGAAIRRLLPLLVVMPLAVGWLRLKGQQAGFYGTEFGVALMVTVTTSLIVALALWNARVQGVSDMAREKALRDDSFLFELGDLLRTAAGSAEALFLVSSKLGQHLGASRCLFIEIDPGGDQATVRRDYHQGRPSLAATRPLSSYSATGVAASRAGHTIVNNDASTDDRTSAQYGDAYAPAGIRSYVAIPLLRGGHWVSTLLVSTHQPRVWQTREVALAQAVAERTWLWFEHLESLEARKRVEHEREELVVQLGAANSELEDRVRARTAQLSSMLKEREVLLQEVHHRVKNNLQVVSSLINMQIRKLEPGIDRGGLEECRSRIEAIALIHEKLYQSRDYAQVPFSDYARSLASNIFHATGVSPAGITLGVEIESIALPVDKAIPCGLILNELITNALKHAFPGDRNGAVRVELRKTSASDILLAVSDDGVGLLRDLDPGTSNTLGMQLVTTLVEQLDGQLRVVRGNGTSFQISFPFEDHTVPLTIAGAA